MQPEEEERDGYKTPDRKVTLLEPSTPYKCKLRSYATLKKI